MAVAICEICEDRIGRNKYPVYFNPYTAGSESDKPLTTVQSQTSLYIYAVWPGYTVG